MQLSHQERSPRHYVGPPSFFLCMTIQSIRALKRAPYTISTCTVFHKPCWGFQITYHSPRSQKHNQTGQRQIVETTWRLKSPGVLGEVVNTDKHHVAMPRLYDLGDATAQPSMHNLVCTTLKPRGSQSSHATVHANTFLIYVNKSNTYKLPAID